MSKQAANHARAATKPQASSSATPTMESAATEPQKEELLTKKANSPTFFFMLWFGLPILAIIALAIAMGRS